MAKSEQQLREDIRLIDTRIESFRITIQRFGNNLTPQEAAVVKNLQAEIQKFATERFALEKQVQALTTTTPLVNPTAEPYKSTTQEALKTELADIDKRIADIKARQITITSPPFQGKYPDEEIRLQRQLNELNNKRRLVEESIKRLNQAQPYVSPPPVLYTPEPPAPQPQTNQGTVAVTRAQQTTSDNFNVGINQDWRVRLYLAENSNYLYKDNSNYLLGPLRESNGVIFPYTPQVQVAYAASYDAQDVAHSNYKLYFYKNSSIENISITTDFTAQDTKEANYLLAVIHFFKSVTKMFYGQDQNPINGSPPPICYLDGFGTYQFNKHPLLITNFQYTLPNDVDYIRATVNPTVPAGVTTPDPRLGTEELNPGGVPPGPKWTKQENKVPTYVPTKIQIVITAIPVISRKDISDNFSLQAYANGSLLLGRDNKNIGAGIW